MKRIAVYPGSFDPMTNGHLDLVKRGRRHFDELIIAILQHDQKTATFSVPERIAFIEDAIGEMDNVRVDAFDGLLVDYADSVGAKMILRGVRAVTDFEYELQLAVMNRRQRPELETVFLVPSEEYSYVSSRFVKQISKLGGNVDGLTTPMVIEAMRKRFAEEA